MQYITKDIGHGIRGHMLQTANFPIYKDLVTSGLLPCSLVMTTNLHPFWLRAIKSGLFMR